MSITTNPSVFVKTPTNRLPAGACCCIFCSIYEAKQALTTIQQCRFVCWFSGTSLSSVWTTNCLAGSNTFRMVDGLDQGFEILTGSVDNNAASISFNDKRHFCPAAAVTIQIVKMICAASRVNFSGWSELSSASGAADFSLVRNSTSAPGCYCLRTNDGCGASSSCACVLIDECFRVHKIELRACDNQLTICGGSANVTKSTDLPNCKMQPIYEVATLTSNTATGRIRYLEAYNT